MLKKYRKREDQTVVAVQLNLDTQGFYYEKWGDTQNCKPGDWIVENNGDVYSIDQKSFADTYEEVGPGQYLKTKCIWAEKTTAPGRINTKEGSSEYEAGDYLVFNCPDRQDGYAVSAKRFEIMYELAD